MISARDHPRSRGVYALLLLGADETMGSSPLARGLPSVIRGNNEVHRIIPARAGFTRRHSDSRKRRRDHPRSRGVYFLYASRTDLRSGSSPLARGLRHTCGVNRSSSWIIPARAGFTPSPVYISTWSVGSSPLARGLHLARNIDLGQSGIIPARAGFTQCSSPAARAKRDHPRSRGVYALWSILAAVLWGSSPLARGLR